MNDITIIFCLPLSEYPVQPDNISKAELVPCPDCNEMMWVTEKKKAFKELHESCGREVIFCCGYCLKDRLIEMKENGEIDDLSEIIKVNI